MKQQSAAVSNISIKTPPYAWVVLFAVYLASLAAPLNLFKVPPMLTTLGPVFDLTSADQGNLMSAFSIMGFILAIPSGFILRRFGVKATILFAVAVLAVGSFIGAMATSFKILYTGRFVEGTGMGLIMVSAPLAISLWFPMKKRGLPMGLWASCIGVGNTITFFFAPALAGTEGVWQNTWWLTTIFSAVAFVVFAIFFRMPKEGEVIDQDAPPPPPADAPVVSPSLFKAMANRNLWFLSICFLTFNLVIMAINTFYPVFLEIIRGYTTKEANLMASLLFLIAIVSAPLGSYISDKVGSRKMLIIIPYIVIAILFLFPFKMTGGGIIAVYLIIMALMMGPVSPVLLAAVPEVMPSPQTIGIGMGVAAFGQQLGMYIGPSLFGKLLGTMTMPEWHTTAYIMVPICAVGIILAALTKVR